MKKRRQAKAPDKVKSGILQIRVTGPEKQAFQEAAELAGIGLSTWARERLRLTAIRELEGAGRRVSFVTPLPIGGENV
jgi:predicted HicB family RNase H-like nuclease